MQWRSTEGTNKGESSNPGGGHSAIKKVARWWRNCNGWGPKRSVCKKLQWRGDQGAGSRWDPPPPKKTTCNEWMPKRGVEGTAMDIGPEERVERLQWGVCGGGGGEGKF